jgi:hypothetical protein
MINVLTAVEKSAFRFEFLVRNNTNLTQKLTQNLTQNKKPPTKKRKWLIVRVARMGLEPMASGL